MKIRYISLKYFMGLLGIIIFTSCEKTANVTMPETDPILVVAGFVAPNEDTIRLKLTWTTPIYYHSGWHESNYEPNAKVVLEGSNSSYSLEYDTNGNFYYTSNANFTVNEEVDLAITYKDMPIVRGKCKIPETPLFTIENKGYQTTNNGDYYENYYKINFTSLNSNPINYYRIRMIGYYSDISGYQYSQNLWLSGGDLFELKQNETTSIKVYTDKGGETTLDSVRAYVIHASDEYYKYHLSVYNYQGDDLFVEPSLIYDNIENGLGNFSAYNMVSDTLIFK